VNAILARIDASDARVSIRIRRWAPAPWLCFCILAATRFGDGWGWLAFAVLLARTDRAALFAGGAAALLATTVFMVLKRCLRRPRPCQGEPHPLFDVRAPDCFSFPSGHTLNAFAVATVLALRYPSAAPLLTLLAAGIGVSRVLLGLHYVSDVVAGAALGAAVGGGVFLLMHGG
jgi:undecaprenyl-diphosphatase